MSMPQTRRWSQERRHVEPTRNAIVGATWALIFTVTIALGVMVAWLLAGGIFTAAAGIGGNELWCSPWAVPDQLHFSLANPRALPEPIPYRGQLGLWEFPDELLPEGWLS